MERLHTWLLLFSVFFIFTFIGTLLQLLLAVYRRIRYGQPILWSDFNPFANVQSLSDAVLPTVLVIGLLNLIGMEFFAKEEIGAFYEKPSYQADYDALLKIDKGAEIFCIATIEPCYGEYKVVKISLPYGKTQFPEDTNFGKDDDKISLSLGCEGWGCDLILDGLASESSYTILSSYIVSNYGDFCASMESDTYHLANCRYIKNIKDKNLVCFQSKRDAEVLGYSFCKTCQELR